MSMLLSGRDPKPVGWVNRDSTSPILLLCEHAGQAIPESLNGLGLPKGVIDRHIGWDIGAEALAQAIAVRLSAPLIVQRYSRLVIDCNRPPYTHGAIPECSDGTVIPKNAALSEADRRARVQCIFDPMEQAINDGFSEHPRRAAFSIHSYTPQMSDGQERPWHAGFLTRTDSTTSQMMIDYIARQQPDMVLALNEPYQLDDASDWFIPAHAEARGLAHSLIEIRNDGLSDQAGIDHWADLLAGAISAVMENIR